MITVSVYGFTRLWKPNKSIHICVFIHIYSNQYVKYIPIYVHIII